MKCKCSKSCEAEVKGHGKYALGHNPASHINRIISKAFRRKMSIIVTGRKQSKQTRAKLRRINRERAPEVQAEHDSRRNATKRKNGSMDKIVKALIKGQKKAWRDPKKRAKRIKKMKAAWKRNYDERIRICNEVIAPKVSKKMKGRGPIGRPRGGRIVMYEGKRGTIRMRCTSEVKYAKYLDKYNIKWLYEAFTFVVGVRRPKTWTPDFYLPAYNKFVEIKGWLLPAIKQKIERCIKHYSSTKFEILSSRLCDNL